MMTKRFWTMAAAIGFTGIALSSCVSEGGGYYDGGPRPYRYDNGPRYDAPRYDARRYQRPPQPRFDRDDRRDHRNDRDEWRRHSDRNDNRNDNRNDHRGDHRGDPRDQRNDRDNDGRPHRDPRLLMQNNG